MGILYSSTNHQNNENKPRNPKELNAESTAFLDCHVRLMDLNVAREPKDIQPHMVPLAPVYPNQNQMILELKSKNYPSVTYCAYRLIGIHSLTAYFARELPCRQVTEQVFELPQKIEYFINVHHDDDDKHDQPSLNPTHFKCSSHIAERDIYHLNENHIWFKGELIQRGQKIQQFRAGPGELYFYDQDQHMTTWRLRRKILDNWLAYDLKINTLPISQQDQYRAHRDTYLYIWEEDKDKQFIGAYEQKQVEMKSFYDEWTKHLGNGWGEWGSWYHMYMVPGGVRLISAFQGKLIIWIDANGQGYLAKALEAPPGVKVQFVRDGIIYAYLTESLKTPYQWQNGEWRFVDV